MNLRFYSGEIEKELRENLESMAEYVMHLQSQGQDGLLAEEFAVFNQQAARETIKDMQGLVCGYYIKNPDTNFYGTFLQEVHPIMAKLKKIKTPKARREFKKLDIIKDSIRCGKRFADKYLSQLEHDETVMA